MVITSNHRTDRLYLPPDDRRHFVAWSEVTLQDWPHSYWTDIWRWYGSGGYCHVAAYLAGVDISGFDPKAPPPKTPAFWAIVDPGRAPEDAELADVFDKMKNPAAVTISDAVRAANGDILDWLLDRKNRRAIPHRLEKCGNVQVRNDAADDGLWVINGKRQAVYARNTLSISDRHRAALGLK